MKCILGLLLVLVSCSSQKVNELPRGKFARNQVFLTEIFSPVHLHLKKEECPFLVSTRLSESFEFGCRTIIPTGPESEIYVDQSYVNEELVLMEWVVDGYVEPLSFYFDPESQKQIRLLLGDDTFFSLALDNELNVLDYSFEANDYRQALAEQGFFPGYEKSERLDLVYQAFDKIRTFTSRQCEYKWKKACEVERELKRINLQSITAAY
ncbi:MAG: hypothetical protein ACJ76H_05000 [Bacteriovoracaceae bacterium]